MKNFEKYIEKHNGKSAKMQAFSKTSIIKKFDFDLSKRDVFDEYFVIYYLLLALGAVFQVASAVSSYAFVGDVLSYKLSAPTLEPYPNFTAVLTIFILIVIEVFKFFLYMLFLRQLFARVKKFVPALFFAVLILSLFSMYASVMGGGRLGTDQNLSTEVSTKYSTEIDSLNSTILEQISTKEKQISTIQESSNYKKIVWVGNGNTKEVLTKEGLDLVKGLRKDIERLQNRMYSKEENLNTNLNKELENVENLNKSNALAYKYLFGIIEVLFVVSQIFVYHFKRQSLLSYELNRMTEATANLNTGPKDSTANLNKKIEATKHLKLLKPATVLDFKKQPVGFQMKSLNTDSKDVKKLQKFLKKYENVVQALEEGKTYSTIVEECKVSKSTVTNVKRCLENLNSAVWTK